MQYLLDQILFYLQKRTREKIEIEVMMYAKDYGMLAKSDGAVALLEQIKQKDGI